LDVARSVAVLEVEGVAVRWFRALRLGIGLIVVVLVLPAIEQLLIQLERWIYNNIDAIEATNFPPYVPHKVIFVVVTCLGWWGMLLLAEEAHPALAGERNVHNKSERRLRLAVSVYAVSWLFVFDLVIATFPDLSTGFFPAVYWMGLLLGAWVYWEVFNVLGKVAGLIRCPFAARHAFFLKRVFAGLYLLKMACSMLVVVLHRVIPDTPLPYPINIQIFYVRELPVERYIRDVLQFLFLVGHVWAIVVFVVVYRGLGRLRAKAGEGGRWPFWVPRVGRWGWKR